MKIIIISFLALIISTAESFGQEYEKYLLKANKSYESGDRETARKLYLEAAEKGNAEAHFALASKYVVTIEESIYHYSEAAKKGHEEALNYALEELLFRANSLSISNPQKALDLYYEAKKANPNLSLYDEENIVKVMKMCAEPKGFDAEQVMDKYGIKDNKDEQYPDYYVWELAEEASREGRFGKPDSELVLNLAIRGGMVPAEFMSAVEEVYANWKKGIVKEFNICDYVTSGLGMAYCASKANNKGEKEREIKLNKLKEKLDKNTVQLLDKAYDTAVQFIELKASNEEDHNGTDYIARIIDSEMKQKNQYLELIETIYAGSLSIFESENSFANTNQKLNEIYQYVLHEVKKKLKESDYPITPDKIKAVQRLWIPYRDASAELFVCLNPSIDKKIWKSWLTKRRIKELKLLLELKY